MSFWHDTVPGSLDPRPSLQSELAADVAIVGAGYAGLWTAYYLKRLDPGLSIVLLEAQIPGFGASGRNGGWCSGYLSGIDAWLDVNGNGEMDAVHGRTAISVKERPPSSLRWEEVAMVQTRLGLVGSMKISE